MKICDGGYGNVFLVKNNNDGQIYAMKSQIGEDKYSSSVFQNEINFFNLKINNIKNNNENEKNIGLVKFIENYKNEEKMYIIMELCEKGSLKEFIKHSQNNIIPEDVYYYYYYYYYLFFFL
jgi:NIMA (never in mitosis gene a)-related kinase